jgi:hypothetical protein
MELVSYCQNLAVRTVENKENLHIYVCMYVCIFAYDCHVSAGVLSMPA